MAATARGSSSRTAKTRSSSSSGSGRQGAHSRSSGSQSGGRGRQPSARGGGSNRTAPRTSANGRASRGAGGSRQQRGSRSSQARTAASGNGHPRHGRDLARPAVSGLIGVASGIAGGAFLGHRLALRGRRKLLGVPMPDGSLLPDLRPRGRRVTRAIAMRTLGKAASERALSVGTERVRAMAAALGAGGTAAALSYRALRGAGDHRR
jgi:hypothetical protein